MDLYKLVDGVFIDKTGSFVYDPVHKYLKDMICTDNIGIIKKYLRYNLSSSDHKRIVNGTNETLDIAVVPPFRLLVRSEHTGEFLFYAKDMEELKQKFLKRTSLYMYLQNLIKRKPEFIIDENVLLGMVNMTEDYDDGSVILSTVCKQHTIYSRLLLYRLTLKPIIFTMEQIFSIKESD